MTAAVGTMTITIRGGLADAAGGGGCSGAEKIAGTMEGRGRGSRRGVGGAGPIMH